MKETCEASQSACHSDGETISLEITDVGSLLDGMLRNARLEFRLQRRAADKPFKRGDPYLIGLDRSGGCRIVIERVNPGILHSNAHEVARKVML